MPQANREVVYRKIPSTNFQYEISRDGRHIRNIKSDRHLRTSKDKDGYYVVNLKMHGRYNIKRVGRLVAEAWIGEAPEGYEVDHIDRDRTNDDFGNLRWVTHKDNSNNRDHTAQSLANKQRLGNTVWVDGIRFDSFTDAARHLGELHNKPYNTVRRKFKERRHNIYGHTINYCRDCTL